MASALSPTKVKIQCRSSSDHSCLIQIRPLSKNSCALGHTPSTAVKSTPNEPVRSSPSTYSLFSPHLCSVPREEQNSSEAHLTVKKLFVAGLREGISEEHLRQHFSRYGNVMEVLVMKDRDGNDSLPHPDHLHSRLLGKPRGFAFVTFDDYDAVDKAVLEKPHMVNGRPLDVKKAVPKEKMQEDSGGGMSSYNRGNSSNYGGGGNGGPPSNQSPSSRNNYSMRDNYNNGNGSWDNQGGMQRMSNPNANYNAPQSSMYDQQGGYTPSNSGYNSSMPPTSGYPQPYTSMGQSQSAPPPPPPPPPSHSQQQPMMNYDMYNNTPAMSYNNNPSSSSNYMQQQQQQIPSYGQNQQQGYGGNANNYGSMNNPFNLPQQSPAVAVGGSGGYGNVSSPSASYDNASSYGITSQNYGGGGYGSMPPQQSRGGGPMRGGRG